MKKTNIIGLTTIVVMLTGLTNCVAEITTTTTDPAGKVTVEKKEESTLDKLKFGLGVGALIDLGSHHRIKDAIVDGAGIIRVQAEDSVRVGPILETHYLFGTGFGSQTTSTITIKENGKETTIENKARTFYWGPQVSALLGGEDIIQGVGLGLVFALRRPDSAAGPSSFNLGAGVMIESNVRKLGDGLTADTALPVGDQIRYKETSQTSFYIVFSASF
jgi:hypothetical protein